MTKEPIKVWAFKDAPVEYQYSLGGDEDWVALLPPGVEPHQIPWLSSDAFSACGEFREFDHGNGYKVVVGSHA
jgi:hypothetical protein